MKNMLEGKTRASDRASQNRRIILILVKLFLLNFSSFKNTFCTIMEGNLRAGSECTFAVCSHIDFHYCVRCVFKWEEIKKNLNTCDVPISVIIYLLVFRVHSSFSHTNFSLFPFCGSWHRRVLCAWVVQYSCICSASRCTNYLFVILLPAVSLHDILIADLKCNVVYCKLL